MKITPLYDRILICRLEGDDVTKSGLVIPDSAKEKPQRGKVVAVGNGRRLKDGSIRPVSMKDGDTVLFEKWAGSEVKIDDVEHLILKEDEILGIID